VVAIVAVAAAHQVDAWAWAHVKDPKVYERDWGRLLRSAGFLPTWFIVAIALCAQDKGRTGWGWRGGMMALAPLAGGALAEVLKLFVRRLRPGAASPEYVFRPYLENLWSNRGMGMPSSHVLVAMSAATILSRLFPRVWWLWYALAAGCAYTRVAAGAHYVSDTVVAAVLGWLVGNALAKWGLNRKPPEALAPGGLELPTR
jgi:membrane-associated phospholipid phosphatase